jgi:hypothetical protein
MKKGEILRLGQAAVDLAAEHRAPAAQAKAGPLCRRQDAASARLAAGRERPTAPRAALPRARRRGRGGLAPPLRGKPVLRARYFHTRFFRAQYFAHGVLLFYRAR